MKAATKGCTNAVALMICFAFFEEEASAVFDGGEATEENEWRSWTSFFF